MSEADLAGRPIVRVMRADDYDQVHALWEHIHGFALRSLDDSRAYVERFLERNPQTSCVAELDGRVVGSILCGHDGRQGSFYHVCVAPECRKQGLGKPALITLNYPADAKLIVKEEVPDAQT